MKDAMRDGSRAEGRRVPAGRRRRQALRDRVGGDRDPHRDPGLRRLRLHGGVPRRRLYRDAKVLEIGEGTSEVQRMLIARGLGLPVE